MDRRSGAVSRICKHDEQKTRFTENKDEENSIMPYIHSSFAHSLRESRAGAGGRGGASGQRYSRDSVAISCPYTKP